MVVFRSAMGPMALRNGARSFWRRRHCITSPRVEAPRAAWRTLCVSLSLATSLIAESLSAQNFLSLPGSLPNLFRSVQSADSPPPQDPARTARGRRVARDAGFIELDDRALRAPKKEASGIRGFFRTGMVTDFFHGARPKQSNSDTFESFGNDKEAGFDDFFDAAMSEQWAEKKDGENSLVERLLMRFGDPDKPVPVQVVENAPVPFKGMMAALTAGHEKLAFAYARQWMRYIRDLQDTTRKIVSVSEVAMEREGMSAPGSSDDNPYKYLLRSEDDEESASADAVPRVSKLGADAKDLLSRAWATSVRNASPHESTRGESGTPVGELPIDPKGEVDVYVFIDSSNAETRRTIAITKRVVERRADGRDRARARYLLLNRPSALEVANLEEISGGIPIVDGTSFAKEFAIESPTTLVVTRTTGQVVREREIHGERAFDRTLSRMMGVGGR